MSKSLQRGILFSICVALILAIALTLVFFAGGGDKNILSAPEGQVSATAGEAQNNVTYTHGSNIRRSISGEVDEVYNKEQFLTAVENNRSMKIMNSFELDSDPNPGESQVFRAVRANREYSGTIYGQGYTISFNGIHDTRTQYSDSWSYNGQSGNFNGWSIGGLVNTLTGNGAIYDLNVVMKSGSAAIAADNDSNVYMGVFAGTLEGNAKVENCTLTINGGGRLMVGRGNQGNWTETSEAWLGVGGIAGRINSTGVVVKNVTVSMDNILIEGGQTTSSQGNTDAYHAITGMVIGMISTNATIDNIRMLGSFEAYGSHEAKVGVAAGSGVEMRTTVNVYDDVTTIRGNTSDVTAIYASESGNAYVTNIYKSSTSDNSYGTDVGNHEIYFDPMESESGNSLAIGFTGQPAIPSGYARTYTLESATGAQYTNQDNFVVSNNGAIVVAKGLPSATSNWNKNGVFTAKLTYKDTLMFEIPKDLIPFYEHGYVADNSVTGKEISSGTEFESAFANGGQAVSGDYYLSKDIAISGFYGESFSGTLDGKGHTIYITGARQEEYGNAAVGGLTGTLTGTIKNVRVVLVDEAGEVSLIKNNAKSNRIGVLVGKVNGGTLENVQVVVESGATLKADMTTAGNDHDMAMGGVVGGTNNATLRGVTMELNGKLDPHGSWTFVGAMAGKIEGTTTFENVILRGNGTLAGHATNGADQSGQPVFAGALGVTSISSTSPTRTVTVNGLIYDFDVKLAGTMRDGAAGNSNGSYSCYYILTNNYDKGMTGGDVTEREPISQYNGAASYSNVFIASDYVTKLEGYAKFRTNGNAPIGLGSTTPYTIARNVSSAAGRYDDARVTAYFQPVTTTIGTSYNYDAGDLVLKVSGHAWAADESLLVNVGGDTGSVISYLEDPASTSSDRIVALSKDEAAAAAQGNSNTVQVREFRHVAQPQLKEELTYTGSGIEVAFVVRYESESGAGQMGEEVPSSAYTVSIEKKEGGTGSVVDGKPVNAGEYVATITLTRGDTFIGSGTGGDSATATVEFTVAPYLVEGTWELSGLTLTYGDPVPSDIDQYIRVTLTSQNIPGGLDAVKAKGFTTNYVQGAKAGTTVNITAGTYTMDASLTASNYDLSGITGSGSVPVQKKTLTIDPVSEEPDHMYDPHISAVYGATGDKAAVQGMLKGDVIDNHIKGNYNGEKVTFTIDKIYIAAYDEVSGAFTLENAVEVADENVASLGANSYLITVTADGDNYTVAEGEFFVYGVIPAPLTVTGVAFEGDFDGVYDGQAHNVTVQYSGELVGGDVSYNFGISINEIDGISVTDAGDYVVTVEADEENVNYDIKFENDVNEYAVTISPITLTISDKSGVYTELTAADIVISDMVRGILEGDTSGVTITPVWDTQPADENEYLAAGTYNATLSLSGDKSDNYTFGTDNVATVKVDPFDLRGAFVTITSEQFTFDGTEKTVEYTVLTAEGGKDITALLTPAGNKQTNANNNYTLTLTGGDNFTGTATAPWSIGKRTLSVTEPTALTFLDKKTSELYAYLTTGNWITGFVGSDSYTGNLWENNPEENEVTIGDVAYAAAGTYTLSINLTGSNANNNYALSVKELSVTINAFDLNGAVMTVRALTYNGEEQTAPVAVTANGVDVTSLLTVSGNTATAAGSNYTAKAEAKDGNFTGSIEKLFTVAQKQLKLESLTLSSVTYTGEPITVTGHTFAAGFGAAGDEQPVLVIAPQGGAVVNAGEYTFNVSLAADNEVNKNYVMAEGAGTITATVSPAIVTVTAAQEAKFGVDFGKNATAETSRFYDSDFITLSVQPDETFTLSSALTFTVKNNATQENVQAADDVYTLAPGTYTVTYTINDIEGANYTLTADGELTTTLTVEEGALKLTIERWENTTLTYNGAAQKPTPVFADSAEIGELPEGALVYEVTAKEGSTLTGEGAVNAGAYTVTVSIAPDFAEQYELAGDNLSIDFTIEKLEVVLKWEAVGDLVYNGKEHTAVATVGNKQSDDVVEVTAGLVNGNDNRNVGEFFFEATGLSGADAGNYSLPAEKRHSFTVTPAQVELTWNFKEHATIVYGDGVEDVKALVDIAALNGKIPGADAPLTFEVSVGDYSATTGAGTEVTFDVSYTLPEGANADNYEITVSAAEDGTDKLTVDKATLTLTKAETASLTKVYDGEAVTLASLLTADNVVVKGMKNGENAFDLKILRISASQQEMTNAAVYDGIVIEIIKDCNYIAADLKIIYTITPKLIGVEWSDAPLTYNGAAQAPTANATGLVGSESLTLNVEGAQTDANAEGQPYTATVTAESVTGNYKLEEDATVEFTIARKSVSVAWGNTQLTYNGSEQAPTAKIAEGGLIGEDEVILTVSGAQTDANQGEESYTATAAITGGADMGNYVLDERSVSTAFTIKPKTVNVTLTADSGDTVDFDVAGSVKAGAWTADGDNANKATLTLSDGATTVTLTAEANEALPLKDGAPALVLLLDNAVYEGTPYGTKVQGGKLTVISADTNYVFEVAQAVTVNITPAITVGLKAGVQTTVALEEVVLGDDTYNAEYFKTNYFQVTGKDGTEVTGGTLEVTITPSEGLEEGAIKHAGAYTVKAEYTPAGAQADAELPNYSFTFTVTPVEVTSVTYSGVEALKYGALGASGEITVTVEYADGTKAENVTAQYASENVSTGGWLKAGSTQVTVNYAGENSDYAAVEDHAVTLSIEKLDIRATLRYDEQSGTSLTLPYIGQAGYSVEAELLGINDGDRVSARAEGDFVNAQENIPATIMLDGDDKDNYNVTGNYSVTITPAEIGVGWSGYEDLTYDGTAKVPVATATGTLDGDSIDLTIVISGNNATGGQAVNAGEYIATVKAATYGNYKLSADSEQAFTVDKAKATLTIKDYDALNGKTYDGNPVPVIPMIDGQEDTQDIVTVIITDKTVYDKPVKVDEIVNAGQYTITLQIQNSMNYADNAGKDFPFTVTPVEITVEWSGYEDLTYDGTAKVPAATAKGTLNNDVVELTVTVTGDNAIDGQAIGAGDYTATVKAFTSGNYKLSADSTQAFTVAKANVTIVWGEQTEFVYSGVAVVPSADVQFNDESVGTATVTCDGDFITEGNKAINIGHYTAKAEFAGDDNFNAASNSFAFEITKATLTVTPEKDSFSEHDEDKMAAYAENAFANTIAGLVTVTGVEADGAISDLTVEKQSVNYQTEGEHSGVWLAVGVHTYSVTAASGNYKSFIFTVEVTAQEMITITATPDSPVYTGSEIGFTYTAVKDGTEFDMTGVTVEIASVKVTLPSASDVITTDVVKDAGAYKVTFTVTEQDDTYYYVVTPWTGDIEQAPVEVQQAAGVYGQIVLTANRTISGTFTTPFVVFNGKPVDVTVAYDGAAGGAALLAEGDSFLSAGTHGAIVTLNDHNFKWEDNASNMPGSFVVEKKRVELDYTPSSTSYSASGISFTLEDHTAAQVGEDSLTVQIVIDGVRVDPLDPPVLNAGTHTVTYLIGGSGKENYDFKPVKETFTLAARKLDPEITVDGQDEISNGGTLNMTVGEQRNIMSAINGYLDRNSVPASDRTITVSGGKDLAAVSAWEPGTYTVTVAFSGNHTGSMAFTVTVSEQAPLPEIPDAPVLPETPLTEAKDGGADWLFPLLIAIVALIDVALVVAIIIVAKKRA